jgi:hypothetical protein
LLLPYDHLERSERESCAVLMLAASLMVMKLAYSSSHDRSKPKVPWYPPGWHKRWEGRHIPENANMITANPADAAAVAAAKGM